MIRNLSKRRSIYGVNSDIWKLRNDSSGVSAALCPERYRVSTKYESISTPNMINGHKRLLIKPEIKDMQRSPSRRPIKECYCHLSIPETLKINQRSTRTRHKLISSSVHIPRENETAVRGDAGNKRESRKDFEREIQNSNIIYSPPLSSATLKRAEKIDYTPRSEFLRRVQSKINSLRNSPRDLSPTESTIRSSSPSTYRSPLPRIPRELEKKSKKVLEGGPQYRRELTRKKNCRCIDNEAFEISKKVTKNTLPPKKTITSIKANDDRHEHLVTRNLHGCRSNLRTERAARISGRDNRKSRVKTGDEINKGRENSCPCSEYRVGEICKRDIEELGEPFETEINDLRKFRDKNYFDTHASNPSLLGSKSSMSLQQFRINERLFPEPMGRVHRDNLVVSIPPCATRQNKGIHYFPRGIVRQEKFNLNAVNTVRKRRCPSCPLIGHAVDLGALKIAHPPNSLALRYQKGIRLSRRENCAP